MIGIGGEHAFETFQRVKRAALASGERSYDLDGLRAVAEGPT